MSLHLRRRLLGIALEYGIRALGCLLVFSVFLPTIVVAAFYGVRLLKDPDWRINGDAAQRRAEKEYGDEF